MYIVHYYFIVILIVVVWVEGLPVRMLPWIDFYCLFISFFHVCSVKIARTIRNIYRHLLLLYMGISFFSTMSPPRPGLRPRYCHPCWFTYVRNHDLQTAVTVFIQHSVYYARLPLCTRYVCDAKIRNRHNT